MFNIDAIKKYAGSETRRHSNAVVRDYDQELYRDWPIIVGFRRTYDWEGMSPVEYKAAFSGRTL